MAKYEYHLVFSEDWESIESEKSYVNMTKNDTKTSKRTMFIQRGYKKYEESKQNCTKEKLETKENNYLSTTMIIVISSGIFVTLAATFIYCFFCKKGREHVKKAPDSLYEVD